METRRPRENKGRGYIEATTNRRVLEYMELEEAEKVSPGDV